MSSLYHRFFFVLIIFVIFVSGCGKDEKDTGKYSVRCYTGASILFAYDTFWSLKVCEAEIIRKDRNYPPVIELDPYIGTVDLAYDSTGGYSDDTLYFTSGAAGSDFNLSYEQRYTFRIDCYESDIRFTSSCMVTSPKENYILIYDPSPYYPIVISQNSDLRLFWDYTHSNAPSIVVDVMGSRGKRLSKKFSGTTKECVIPKASLSGFGDFLMVTVWACGISYDFSGDVIDDGSYFLCGIGHTIGVNYVPVSNLMRECSDTTQYRMITKEDFEKFYSNSNECFKLNNTIKDRIESLYR